ncbi:MAG TPA: autotransporter-associated beta strand repeat-containing protein [Verrucomicrobiae bacterium]|nr:autotransporter-associated beta strand repeat-containing protein [Verrucomicrobiae bacterium]
MNTNYLKILALTGVLSGLGALSLNAQVTMTGDDAFGVSSFNAKGNWSDALAPHAGTNYLAAGHLMRTPGDANNYTFQGDSLTLDTPLNSANGTLIYKGSAGTNIYTIPNLILAGGLIRSGAGSVNTMTIAGNINVTADSTIQPDQSPFIISANLSGTGALNNLNPGNHPYSTVTYSGTNTAFTGKFLLGPNELIALANPASVPGNPAAATPDQITLAANATLQANTNIMLNNANGGITLAGNANLSFGSTGIVMTVSVPITGSAALTKRGGGILTLSGNNDFSGGLTLLTFTAGSQLNINHPNALGLGAFTLGSGAVAPALLDNTSGAPLTVGNFIPSIWNSSLTFLGSSSLNFGGGGVTLGADVTVTVANNTLSVGAISGDGQGRALTKMGPGIFTIDGGGYYLGNTTVGEGTLVLSNSAYLSSPKIVVSSNATLNAAAGGGLILNYGQALSGDGTVLGDVSDGAGSTVISPGTTVGTLTVNGNVNLNGNGAVTFGLSPDTTVGGGVNDLLVVGGQLNLAGPTTINLVGTTALGTYTLIQYGSFTGDIANLQVPPGFAVTNNAAAKAIQLIVTHVPASLTWQGDGVQNLWDVGVTPNWLLAGTNQFFLSGDTVTFDDSGTNTPAITLSSDLSPAAVNVNAAKDYTLTGGGIITGSLTKNGTGTLVLDNTNTYSGPTVITGGTLQLGDPTGGTFGNAGTLGKGAVTNNASLVINHADNVTLSNNITGSGRIANIGPSGTVNLAGSISGGTVTMAGQGGLILSSSNSYAGLTTVASGSLQVANGSALGDPAAGTVVSNGAQLFITLNVDVANEPLSLSGDGPLTDGALRKGGGGMSTYGGAITLTGDARIKIDGGATLNLTNAAGITSSGQKLILTGDNGSAGLVSGPINLGNGAGTLTKTGASAWTLAGSNSMSLATIDGGALILANNDALGTNKNVVLTSTTGGPGLSGTRLTLSGGITLPADRTLFMPSSGTGTIRSSFIGTGVGVTNIWAGAVKISGDGLGLEANQVGFGVDANSTFIINGPITTDGTFAGGKINIRGNSTGVGIIAGTMTLAADGQIQVDDGSTWIVSSTGNTWGTNRVVNGTLKLGANNALPTASVITDNSRFDLAGFNQTIAGLNSGCTINNSSTTADATLTYSSGNPSTFTGTLNDGSRKLNLTVAAGTLTLSNTSPLHTPKSTVTVAGGAVLDLEFAGTNTVAGLVLNGASMAPGYYSSTTSAPYLAGPGVLQVASPGPSGPGYLTSSVSGNTLSLSWPDEGWKLQMQTNSLAAGLGTNWVYVTDGSVTSTNITVDPQQPATFYRLVYP